LNLDTGLLNSIPKSTTFCASPAPIPKIALPFVILSRVIAERAIDDGCLLIALGDVGVIHHPD